MTDQVRERRRDYLLFIHAKIRYSYDLFNVYHLSHDEGSWFRINLLLLFGLKVRAFVKSYFTFVNIFFLSIKKQEELTNSV